MEAVLRAVEGDECFVERETDEEEPVCEEEPQQQYGEALPVRTGILRWLPALLGLFGMSGSALVICILACFVSNATAVVRDAKTHDPIANVIIKRDDDKEFEAMSDHDGLFRPNGDLSGEPTVFLSRLFSKFKLTVEKDQYEPVSTTCTPLDFLCSARTIYLSPRSEASSSEAGTGPKMAEAEPVDVAAVLQEIDEIFGKKGFEINDRLYSPIGTSYQRAYVISDDAEQRIAEKLQIILPILQSNDAAMKTYLENHRDEAVAIGLYSLWDSAGSEVRGKVSFFLYETLLNMQNKYRCKQTLAGWQKAREFRKRAYYHFINEFPSWLAGSHAKCAVALGTYFCDLMVSADAAPVDDGEKKRTGRQRIDAALNQRTALFGCFLRALNTALINKTIAPDCDEVKWARRKLLEIASRPESRDIFTQPEVKQPWAQFLQLKVPPCEAEPQCHCLIPRTIK